MDEGFCVRVISGAQGYVSDKEKVYDELMDKEYTWWDLRPMMVQIPYFSYVELKKWIIQECKQSGQCDSRVSSWDRTLQTIDESIIKKMK